MEVPRKHLNTVAECRELHLRLWECPPFLFLIMGVITIVSMVATYLFASRYIDEPEIAALVVIAIAATFFIIGNFIISGFSKIAEAHQLKSEFISIASHQLRSPLSVIKWTLDRIEKEVKNEEVLRDVETIYKTTEHMIHIVNSLLEVNRIEAGLFELRKHPLSLASLARETVESFRSYANASNVTLVFEAQDGLPPILGDRDRIMMAIENLIDNAIRYSRDGENKVVIKVERHGDNVQLSITDEGIGIPRAQQSKIFQKFYRAQGGKRSQVDGSGIGLFVTRAIIERLGGIVGFSSEEGKGSTFWFILPAVIAK